MHYPRSGLVLVSPPPGVPGGGCVDSQDSLWLARESGLDHRTVEFRGRATMSLGIREGFLSSGGV